MLIHSSDGTSGSFFSHLLDRARSAISRWRELNRLDIREIEAVAHELSISPSELVTLMMTSSESLGSLDKRLAYEGLALETLAASYPAELRDMRRICGQCPTKARCARDLRHKRMATPSKYCPNEPTLRALALDTRRDRSARPLSSLAKLS